MTSEITNPVSSSVFSNILSPDSNPLNPRLYEALVRQFGTVKLSNAGQERQVRYSPDPNCPGKLRAEVQERGEQYNINCPFCSDERQRLYMSYQYNQLDPVTRGHNENLWYCHNEKCHKDPRNRQIMQARLTIRFRRQIGSHARADAIITPTTRRASPADPTFLPEELIPIHELPATHPAVEYLLSRNFDPLTLWTDFRICYCSYSRQCRPSATYRLVIPVFDWTRSQSRENSQPQISIVGWQARAIPGLTPDYENIPRYLTAAGLKKGELLYGLPQAIHTPGPVFLCEGAADVWRAGRQAVGLFGNQLSLQQKQLLLRSFPQRPIVVLLDMDAREEAIKIVETLRAARQATGGDHRVVMATLPPGRKDPGECTQEEIFQAAHEALMPQGTVQHAPNYHQATQAQPVPDKQILPLPQSVEELALAARLLDENAPFDLPSLVNRFLPKDEAAVSLGTPIVPSVTEPIDEQALIQQLGNQGRIGEQLEEQDLTFLYREIEVPVLVPLEAMRKRGVFIDVSRFEDHCDRYPELIARLKRHLSPTGRVYPQLNPIGSCTGRITCSKPNLQGLPAELRDAVIAEEGHRLLSADLSEFELRILAHFTQEPAFVEVYQSGHGDLHRYTASRLYEVSLEGVTEEKRKFGKTVNFSIINGQTAQGLAPRLNIPNADAQLFIDDFKKRYPQVASWIDQSIQKAREQGYVTSLYGRRRHLPDLSSDRKRAQAERQIVSGIIQATGAEIFKWLLCRLHEKLPAEFKMILPVHDAVLFEIPDDRVEEAKQLICEVMQQMPPKFTVPLVANVHVGKSWRECQG